MADQEEWSYDVFLSFRGEDTRKTFTDHLYTALVDAGLVTFRDDEELERGEEIRPELERAIRLSRCSIVVLSKNYASSTWCLDELVLILERKRRSQHQVLPVFYDVDPSEVRNLRGNFGKAFAIHKKKYLGFLSIAIRGIDDFWLDRLEIWRAALKEVANLSGLSLRDQTDGHESRFIKKIVTVIQKKVNRKRIHLIEEIPSTVGHLSMGPTVGHLSISRRALVHIRQLLDPVYVCATTLYRSILILLEKFVGLIAMLPLFIVDNLVEPLTYPVHKNLVRNSIRLLCRSAFCALAYYCPWMVLGFVTFLLVISFLVFNVILAGLSAIFESVVDTSLKTVVSSILHPKHKKETTFLS